MYRTTITYRRIFRWVVPILVMGVTASTAAADGDRYIVKFRSTAALHVGALSRNIAPDLHGATPSVLLPRDNAVAAVLNTEQLTALTHRPDIESIEVDTKVHAFLTPNDPRFSDQYGLSTVAGTSAVDAWNVSIGSPSALVAVVDSGVDYGHDDLQTSIWKNPGEVPGNGVDDDGNGLADDYYGYDFANNDGEPLDDNGHGTHVAGTIAAAGNNAIGGIGVAWGSQVVAIKCLDGAGSGYNSDLVRAIDYAVTLKDQGYPLVAINMSLGGEYTNSLYRAISRASERGILLVAAAGNETSNNDRSPTYPASFDLPNIISVAATNTGGTLAEYSNYGRTSVDIAAPGSAILSTEPRIGGVSQYGYESGTSMAAPHVSGIAALIAAANPAATSTLIRSIMISTAKPEPSLSRKTVSGGIVDAYAAVLMAQGQQLYKITGSVKRSGRGLTGVSMIITPKNGVTTRRTTRTNSKGSYSVANLPLGTYTVKARSSRYRITPSTVKVDLTKNTRTNFTISR